MRLGYRAFRGCGLGMWDILGSGCRVFQVQVFCLADWGWNVGDLGFRVPGFRA